MKCDIVVDSGGSKDILKVFEDKGAFCLFSVNFVILVEFLIFDGQKPVFCFGNVGTISKAIDRIRIDKIMDIFSCIVEIEHLIKANTNIQRAISKYVRRIDC